MAVATIPNRATAPTRVLSGGARFCFARTAHLVRTTTIWSDRKMEVLRESTIVGSEGLSSRLRWNLHVNRDRVEAGYRKTGLFEDGREPTTAWAGYLPLFLLGQTGS